MYSVLFVSVLVGQIPVHTTVADSSRVAFIAQTPLSWESAEYNTLDFIRFTDISVSDSVGYPEVPMITCLVALPDSVTPSLEFAFSGLMEQQVDPVYPAPAQVISYEYTPAVVDSFVQDSTAYASSDFWPASRVRVIGETRICDQRLYQVQLFPALYRASDSTLSTVSSISVSLSFDSASAEWSSTGLGPFQDMARGSSIIGYHAVTQTRAPNPEYFGQVDPDSGPARMPDYVIICASGLYDDCDEAIDSLAEHRVDLNNFDVALVTTDDILEDFGGFATAITDEIIRDFTEHMWKEWTQASVKKPGYLLLIGDHEDSDSSSADWFLPTHQYLYGESYDVFVGNDEWYAYFNGDTSIDNDYPDMMVGRLAVKNGESEQTDTLSTLIYNLIDLEDPITQIPIPDYRRRIVRLAGTGTETLTPPTQIYYNNPPEKQWTYDFAGWMDYDYATHYCGDGRDFTDSDSSLMQSCEFRDSCLTEFGDGAGVVFYTDHGDLHLFSAGLEYWQPYIPQDSATHGARDSTFNNYQIEQNLSASNNYASPFILLLCCSSGTFNHTIDEHDNRAVYPEFCFYNGQTPPARYNFGTDCIAEKLLKFTDVPVAGVFSGSQPSLMTCYDLYGRGILEAIYVRGFSRLGDAIASSRLEHSYYFFTNAEGTSRRDLGQFNLLGDPALDISDRVRFPDDCDLVAYSGDLNIWNYPYETASGAELPISFTVRNNGAQDSDEYDIRIIFKDATDADTVYITDCDEIPAGEYDDLEYTWDCENWFDPPVELTVLVEADYLEECDDSWLGNNTAEVRKQLNAIYPSEEDWPIYVHGAVSTTPVLVNLDGDPNLEIVALTGPSLTAFEQDGTVKWELCDAGIYGSVHPLATDLDHDGTAELIVACDDGIMAVATDGEILDTTEDAGKVSAVGNIYSTSGLELCIALGETLYLYSWNSVRDEFSYIGSKRFTLSGSRTAYSVSCADMNDDSYADVIFCCGEIDMDNSPPGVQNLIVYDWIGSTELYSDEWTQTYGNVHPAAGELAGTAMVGYPFGGYDPSSEYPAILVEPDGTFEAECDTGTVAAGNMRFGVFADWSSTVTGADAFVLPSERECLAWNDDGNALSGWPTDEYSGAELNMPISPTALGDLNDAGYSDVLFCTWLSDGFELLGYGSNGQPLSGFPIGLPEDVSALGGFAIADIDRDGSVEVVFGTSDGLLHCWELGDCTTGYAPWPQFQHDQSRTGVLE